MTIHVNIGDAKTRLPELVAAALRGEDVVLQRSGTPKVRLVAMPEALELERETRAVRRRASIGFGRDKYAHLPPEASDVPSSMTAEEDAERHRRKFDASAA